ncbi:MAG: NUDIX hydrolase [Caulobacteraceae bacterium]
MTQPFDSAADLIDAPRVTGARMRPRDAATLILVRRDGPEPRVLMGRRAEGHVFMAAKWVFPGGRVDRADFHAPYAADLSPETAAALQRGAIPSRARALGLAAIRETFEEAGLLLALPCPARPAAGPWREFAERGVAPDLSALTYVARAITPPGRSRRFDARFFMAYSERLVSLEPARDADRELDEIAWIEPSKAGDFDLPQITRFVLKEVTTRLAQGHGARPIPFVRMVRGQHRVETA